jgi:peptidoglycan/LPS O-acetylase OafA/YrhL
MGFLTKFKVGGEGGADVRRISSLDGLRFFAIFFVALYHYYARWAVPLNSKSLYPYGDLYAQVSVFKYGSYGVQLFFIISGFVIAITLGRCRDWIEFGVRRFSRLWPSMLLCSVLTYVFMSIYDDYFYVSFWNFLPSLTFVDPAVYRALFNSPDFFWMDGAYWSLYVEVRFYFLMAVLYFGFRSKFSLSFAALAVVVTGFGFYANVADIKWLSVLLNGVFFVKDLPWFVLGVGLFYGYKGERRCAYLLLGVGMLALALESILQGSFFIFFLGIGLVTFVWMALEVEWLGRFLSFPLISMVGMSSYSLYLLHQSVGVAAIGLLGGLLNPSSTVLPLVPVFVFVTLSILAAVIFRYWESPMDKLLIKILGRRFRKESNVSLGA